MQYFTHGRLNPCLRPQEQHLEYLKYNSTKNVSIPLSNFDDPLGKTRAVNYSTFPLSHILAIAPWLVTSYILRL